MQKSKTKQRASIRKGRCQGTAVQTAAVALLLLRGVSTSAAAEPASADFVRLCGGADASSIPVTGRTVHYGSVTFDVLRTGGRHYLVDCARRIMTFDASGAANLRNAAIVSSDTADFSGEKHRSAVSAHWAAQKFHDFAERAFGWRSGFAGKEPLRQYVRFGDRYFNASYDKGVVVYGEGGDYNSTPIVSADYIAHELTHGVSLSTSNMIYEGESAALNESFSDIVANAFLHDLFPDRSGDWDMFADIYRDKGMSTRSLAEPGRTGAPSGPQATDFLKRQAAMGKASVLQPGAKDYLGPGWIAAPGAPGAVYANAGVQNHWYYLLANGGSKNDLIGRRHVVEGVGERIAAAVIWHAYARYMPSDADYLDARYATERAARELFGADPKVAEAVSAAWEAASVNPTNYKRLPHPRRGIDSISVTYGDTRQVFDAALGCDAPHPDSLGAQTHAPGRTPWFVQSSSLVHTFTEFLGYQNWAKAAGKTFEIRFTGADSAALFETSGIVKKLRAVPFEVWNLGEDIASPADDVRQIPIVFDVDADQSFGVFAEDRSGFGYTRDHPALPGRNDRWTDMIHVASPKDGRPGDAGYRAFLKSGESAISARQLNWLSFIRPEGGSVPDGSEESRPATGSTFRITLSRGTKSVEGRQAEGRRAGRSACVDEAS